MCSVGAAHGRIDDKYHLLANPGTHCVPASASVNSPQLRLTQFASVSSCITQLPAMPAVPSDFSITQEGDAAWDYQLPPSHEQFATFVERNREQIRSLSMTVDHGPDYPPLDFEDIGVLPNLKRLYLKGVSVNALVFTTANTPALEDLILSLLSCAHEDGLKVEFALPRLRTFFAEHITVNGPCDFGLCLSRCPLLEKVETYKFCCLSGDNFAVLPNCETLSLYRSECTDSLEILSAPKLTELSVRAAFHLENLKLWDLNGVTVEDVESLGKELDERTKEIGDELFQWLEKWKNETYDSQEASDSTWSESEDMETSDSEDDPVVEDMYHDAREEMDRRREEAKHEILNRLIEKISQRGVRNDGLPRCTVNCINASVKISSLQQLEGNKRVDLVLTGELDP